MNGRRISTVLLTFWFVLLTVGLFTDPVLAADPEWPMEIKGPKGSVVIYQPQPETFENGVLTGRSAVALYLEGKDEPVFGAVWISAKLATDRDARSVAIEEIDIPQVRFPGATPEQEAKLTKFLLENFPKDGLTISQDRLLATLEVIETEKKAAENLENAPPRIIVTTKPSVLVVLDGKPELQSLKDSKIMRVVNTPFIILFDPGQKSYFLKGGPTWFVSADILGPFKVEANPPQEVLAVMPKEQAPGESSGDQATPSEQTVPPEIIVVMEPAELIVSDGPPKYTPIPGTDMMYMTNTQSDVFMDINTQEYLVLLSGRWYKTSSLEKGPWSYVPADRLPAGLAKIPAGSEKEHVLAQVAGTVQAEDAVMDAQIPQTATVKREKADIQVPYDGQAKFEPIEDTGMDYAVNTDYAVIRAEGRYYLCHEGVWYESGVPSGPWSVCVMVPPTIYTIPPSCPIYNVRYVYVYDYTPAVVRVGYLPGYMGSYVYGPVVVFGTGYHYPAWHGSYYYPRPVTFGFQARYNPYTGSWGFGFSVGLGGGYYNPVIPGGGWLAPGFGVGFAAGAAAGSAWGHHHGGWWGPGGYRGPGNVNVNIGQINVNRQNNNFQWNRNNIYRRTENIKPAPRPYGPGPGQGKRPDRIKENNVFTDRDGNVYRRTDQGWQKHGQDGWARVKPNEMEKLPGPGLKQRPGQVKPGQPQMGKPVTRPEPGPTKPGQPKVEKPVARPQPGPVKPGQPKVEKPVARPQPGPTKPGQPKVEKPVARPQPGPAQPGQAKPGWPQVQKPAAKSQPGQAQPGRLQTQRPQQFQQPTRQPSGQRQGGHQLENDHRARQHGGNRESGFQKQQGGGGRRQ